MILQPGLAIKIVNEKKSQSYRLLKGISSKNVYHRIQMTLMQCKRQFYYKIVYPKEICKCKVYSDNDKTIADRFNQFFYFSRRNNISKTQTTR